MLMPQGIRVEEGSKDTVRVGWGGQNCKTFFCSQIEYFGVTLCKTYRASHRRSPVFLGLFRNLTCLRLREYQDFYTGEQLVPESWLTILTQVLR